MNYTVHLLKTVIASLTALVFAAFAVIFFLMRFWIVGGIFVALLAVYCVVALRNCMIIHIGNDKIYRVFPRSGTELLWSEIEDVGIVGTKVLGKTGRKYTGARYIYFSRKKLDEAELFDMCLKWPPEDIIYIHFNYKRIEYIQKIWAREVTMYNTGNLQI